MKFKKFRKHLLALALLAVIGVSGKYVISGTNDLFTIVGHGSLWGIEVLNVESDGDATLYSGDLVFSGEASTADSANAGTYQSLQVRVRNNSGTAISIGDVCLADATSQVMGNVNIANVTSTTSVVGVAVEAIANGSTGLMAVSGFALVKTTGTVLVGQVLVSSAPAGGGAPKGYASGTATPTSGTDIGVAMESATATDLILMKLR